MTNIFLSVIIPTYNRSHYLIKILKILRNNLINFNRFEVIIVDSFSKDSTNLKIKYFKNSNKLLNINYLNCAENIHSIKRNLGIKNAKGKYIILLDDDCFPEKDFLKNYYNIFLNEKKNKNIYCGSVVYPKNLTRNNFLKYRSSKHFTINKKEKISNKNLESSKIVTMNMGFKKSHEISKTNFFNENFNIYGFEDYEFAHRLLENNFKIKACSPLVLHNDLRSFQKYLNKIRFLGFEGMKYLIKINLKAAKNNNFYKLENFFLMSFFLKLSSFRFILRFLTKISILLEKYYFYSPWVYKTGIACSYLIGFADRKFILNKNLNNKNWYK